MQTPTTEKHQICANPTSIETYLAALERKRTRIANERKAGKVLFPLTFGQYCRLMIAHGSNHLAQRGETIPFLVDEDNIDTLKQLYFYFTDSPSFSGSLSKGILLVGGYGTGKTVIFKALRDVYEDCMKSLNASRQPRQPEYRNMKFLKSSDIVDAFRSEGERSKTPNTNDAPKIDIRKKSYADNLLIIDEVGREQKEVNVYGTVVQPLSQVLTDRYDTGIPTLATANFKLETLAGDDFYGKMLGDRFRQMFNVLTLAGQSRRK